MMTDIEKPWETEAQEKNMAWYLPRPKPDHYKGGFPLHAEKWLIKLAENLIGSELKDEEILQPFAGKVDRGVRVDIKEEVNPDVVADAHNLPFEDNKFKLIICDPPYSDEEAEELYDTPSLNYNKWSNEAVRVMKPEGVLVLYHKKMLPNPAPEELQLIQQVFIANRVWHLPRIARYFSGEDYSL